MTKRTEEQKRDLVEQIKAANSRGTSLKEACATVGVAVPTYHAWKKSGVTPKKRAYKKRKTIQVLDIPVEREFPLVILMGRSKDVFNALERVPR